MSSQSLDLFFRACEVPDPPTLRVEGGPVSFAAMGHPFAVVGSDPRCDVVIDDPSVYPRHCYFQAIGSKVLCIDLGGGRGGAVSHGPPLAGWIDERHAVKVGDRLIRLAGASEDVGGPDDGEVDNQRLLTNPVPRIALEFQTDTVKTCWRMRRPVVLVGSARECTVKLNGSSVARFHCALVHTGLGLWVVDLLGEIESPEMAGVLINLEPVRFGRLDLGDVLQVGGFCVSLRALPPSAKRSRPADSGRVVAELLQGSGEIELSSGKVKEKEKEKARPGGVPVRQIAEAPTSLEIEAVRRVYDGRLDAQAAAHRTEVEGLLGEIKELRHLVEELRSARPSTPRRRRGISVRVLGTATRRAEATPTSPENALSGLAIVRPDLPPLNPVNGDPWPRLDGLLASTQETRHGP